MKNANPRAKGKMTKTLVKLEYLEEEILEWDIYKVSAWKLGFSPWIAHMKKIFKRFEESKKLMMTWKVKSHIKIVSGRFNPLGGWINQSSSVCAGLHSVKGRTKSVDRPMCFQEFSDLRFLQPKPRCPRFSSWK